jgi:hypothetical protein
MSTPNPSITNVYYRIEIPLLGYQPLRFTQFATAGEIISAIGLQADQGLLLLRDDGNDNLSVYRPETVVPEPSSGQHLVLVILDNFTDSPSSSLLGLS